MAACSMTVDALLTGMPVPFRDGEHSAIAKRPVSGAVRIGWLGLEGDGVADSVHHGGWDKAIHLYPQDHYGWWRERKPGHPLLEKPGAFGENIARSEEHTSELQSLMRISYAVFCLKKKNISKETE